MTPCDRVASLRLDRQPLPTELAAHAAACPDCASLAALDRAFAALPATPLEASAELRAALAYPLAPARSRSSWQRALPAVVGLALLVVVSLALRRRDDLAE